MRLSQRGCSVSLCLCGYSVYNVDAMNWMQAVILGIVEGITEFLPISSTGHLILASAILGISQDEFVKTFEIAIQLGAILSVVVLYARSLLVDRDKMIKVIIAFIPTAVIGLLLYKMIKRYLLGNQMVVVIALIVGGILLIVFELLIRRRKDPGSETIPPAKAAAIGVIQSLAMFPGVSRSAATIVGGLSLGISRVAIVEFSFLLAVPTMAAAVGLDLLKSGTHFSANQWSMLAIGFVVSFVVALLSIKFLLRFIQHHTFISFGIYRIVAGLLFWFFMLPH